MEWYQTGGADFSANSADYTYDAMGGTSTSATYGSFEDEAPLLEGVRCKQASKKTAFFHASVSGLYPLQAQ